MSVHLGAYQKKPVMIELACSHIYMYSCIVSKGGCCGSDSSFLVISDPIDTLSYTFLISCGHKFCDDCWRGHVKTQLQQGHTDISCPGYKCTVAVDDVTLMSLLPTWYGKFVTKKLDKILEIHPEWKWCPEDRCTLFVKATTPQSTTDLCDEHVGPPQPVPVVCVCGSMWCFKCQEDAHWPATCEEAKTFRENTKGYAKMVARSQTSPLITSVQIKNCPFCHYPIQKGPGCNHMMCGLCSKSSVGFASKSGHGIISAKKRWGTMKWSCQSMQSI